MRPCQDAPRLDAGRMHANAVDDRIGTGKVDMLERAYRQRFGLAAPAVDFHAVRSEDDDFSRFDVAHECCTDGAQGAAFGSDDIGVVGRFADAKRVESLRVSDADELLGRHDDEGVCAFEEVHSACERLFDGRRAQSFARGEVGDCLRIARRVKDRAAQLEFVAQHIGITEIAVVRYGHAAFLMVHFKRLAVASVAGSGGGVADMADGDAAWRECLEDLGRKDVAYKPQVFVRDEDPVVVADYAAAFLASVLQRVQAVADRVGGVYRPR